VGCDRDIGASHNLAFGCRCLLFEWVDDHLIFVYKEKHKTYICSYREGSIKTFHFDGERISKKDNLILFDPYHRDPVSVRGMSLPDLIEVDPLPREDVKAAGCLPEDVDLY
jgi:hypothetical protein